MEDEVLDAFVDGWKDVPDNEPSEQPEEEQSVDLEKTEVNEDPEDDEELEGDKNDEEDPTDDDAETDEDVEQGEDVQEDEEPEDDVEEEAEEPEATKVADEDAVIRYEVDGETLELSVSEAKRLAGQDAAINQRSEKLATEQKEFVAQKERTEAALNISLKQAEERFKPYAEVDWVLASKRLDEEELTALRGEAEAAYADYSSVKENLDGYIESQHKDYAEKTQETIQNTRKALEDPLTGIPGFNEEVYNDLVKYAVSNGFSQETASQFITPDIFHVLHKAQLFDKGKAVVTKKVKTTPKKTLSSKKAVSKKDRGPAAKQRAAQEALKKSGSVEDAANALLADWEG